MKQCVTPIVGITVNSATFENSRGCPDERYESSCAVSRSVADAGGAPVLLPHVDPSLAPTLLSAIDALIISGGDFDHPPSYFGQDPHPKLGKLNNARSEFERALLRTALEQNMPTLTVCGGMQLLNIVQGGTLFQDLSLRPNTQVHVQPHDKRQPAHRVTLDPQSTLAQLTQLKTLEVNSTHHQVLDKLGSNLRIAATADDGVVEAIELEGQDFMVGVQWHPEHLPDDASKKLYAGLLAAAG